MSGNSLVCTQLWPDNQQIAETVQLAIQIVTCSESRTKRSVAEDYWGQTQWRAWRTTNRAEILTQCSSVFQAIHRTLLCTREHMNLATTYQSLITTTFQRLKYVERRFVNELVQQENRAENYSILIRIPHNFQCRSKGPWNVYNAK